MAKGKKHSMLDEMHDGSAKDCDASMKPGHFVFGKGGSVNDDAGQQQSPPSGGNSGTAPTPRTLPGRTA